MFERHVIISNGNIEHCPPLLGYSETQVTYLIFCYRLH